MSTFNNPFISSPKNIKIPILIKFFNVKCFSNALLIAFSKIDSFVSKSNLLKHKKIKQYIINIKNPSPELVIHANTPKSIAIILNLTTLL